MYMYMPLMMLMISSFIALIPIFIIKKTYNDREKSSTYECGFDPKTNSRMPFSLHFFLIAIIFLIFDIEITLLIPIFIMFLKMNKYMYLFIMSMFFLIILLGTYHEWVQGSLSWMK